MMSLNSEAILCFLNWLKYTKKVFIKNDYINMACAFYKKEQE